MKMTKNLIAVGVMGISLALSASTFAETAKEKEIRVEREARERAARRDSDRDRTANPRDVQSPSALVYAKDIVGQSVVNTEGKEIGHIADLIVDPRNGTIQYGVLAVGKGFLGIGDKNIAIPWDDLHLSATQKGYLLDVDKGTLAKAPAFERDHPVYDRDYDRYRDYRVRDGKDVRREPLRDDQDTYVGTVESIDRDNNTITVKKALISHKFLIDDAARIPLDRIRVGEKVEVVYTKRENAKVAQYIDVLDGNARTDRDGDGRIDR